MKIINSFDEWYNKKKFYKKSDYVINWNISQNQKMKLINGIETKLNKWISNRIKHFLFENEISTLVDVTIYIKMDGGFDCKKLNDLNGYLNVCVVVEYLDDANYCDVKHIETSVLAKNGVIY